MNFRSYLACLTLLFIGMSAHSTQELPLNLITATPIEITSFLESQQYINDLAEQCLNDGLANIPLANLEQLLAHEQLAAKILSCMNDINGITEENMHLFAKPVIDNFLSLSKTELGYEVIRRIVENYPDETEQPFTQAAIDNIKPVIDNFSSLSNTFSGCITMITIIELHPDAAKLFVQPVIDNFSSLASTEFGCETLSRIMEIYPESAQLFVQPAINNFCSLTKTELGYWVIREIIEILPQTKQQFVKAGLTQAQKLT